ncbi:outer membrane protein [Microbaculum marinum]|uniref:Outer membrane protein n=1 Tax=Microbaculum marinum TaxID=1764581 RepID=A0AAW9RVA2_9HYPH
MLRRPIRFGVAILALTATPPVLAADISAAPPPAAPAPEVAISPDIFDWSGLYVGAHAGYLFGNSDVGFGPLGGLSTMGVETDGFAGGGQVGFNWQMDRLVLGGEADLSWANLEGSHTSSGGVVQTRADWLSTVRGRAGVAFDRVLVYGTGGVAFTSMETSFAGPPGYNSDKQGLTGWTAGAGVEWAMTDNLSLKGEYLYVDFSDEPYLLGAPTPTPVDLDGSYVRVGVNYKFNLF